MDPFLPRPLVLEYLPAALMMVLSVAGWQEFRQGHVGRVSILGNVVLAWQLFYSHFEALPLWAVWYLNVGTVVGGLAGLTYLFGSSLPSPFYRLAGTGYGSITLVVYLLLFMGIL